MARLLLLSNTTGYQANAFRQAAERIGVEIALATDRCHVLDDPWNDRAIAVKFHQPLESAGTITERAGRMPFDGVVAIGDFPALTAAMAAERLGLRFHSPAAVDACRNKWIARERWAAARMLVPWYKRFPADENPRKLVREVPFPCVLKPLGLSASRGVIRANGASDFVNAFRCIADLLSQAEIQLHRDDSTSWIQVESYIPGQEFAVEGLVTEGRLKALALFDKPDPLEGPFFEETIYVTPSRSPYSIQQAIVATTQQAVTVLGLANGPIHAEMRVNERGVWMLEIAARPIGGLCAKALRFSPNAMPLEELIVRHALGEDISGVHREEQASGVMMIPIPEGGFYEGVSGVEQSEKVAGIESVEITAKLRQKLIPLPVGSSYLGFIFARGETPEFVEEALRQAHARLQFSISAEIPLVR